MITVDFGVTVKNRITNLLKSEKTTIPSENLTIN